MQTRWTVALAWLCLAILMVATRFPGLASNLHLQDASWAVFFVAGFYLRKSWRWAFPGLLAVAVAVDLVAIYHYDVTNYCVTWAYWFLVPSYGALWLGGKSLPWHASFHLAGIVSLAASAMISITLCFLISNGSFYWLGGRVPQPTWGGWEVNLATWYAPFLRTAATYIAVVAGLHVLVLRLLPRSAVSV